MLGTQKVLSIYLGVAQMVARYLGVVEAAGSSPVTQMNKSGNDCFRIYFFSFKSTTDHAVIQRRP